MKILNTFWTIFLLGTIILLSSCKEDEPATDLTGSYRVKQIVYTNFNTGKGQTYSYAYDSQNRNNNYTYTSTGFSGTFAYGVNTTITEKYITDNNSLVTTKNENTSDNQTAFKYLITYDGKRRIIKISASNLIDYSYATIENTWDGNNIIQIIYNDYDKDGNIILKYIIKYSGFSSDNPNTLKAANFGLDFFGNYGAFAINLISSQVYSCKIMYAGGQLPTNIDVQMYYSQNPIYETYSANITYTKDTQNRISNIHLNTTQSDIPGYSPNDNYTITYQ